MIYDDPQPISHSEAEEAMHSRDPSAIADAVIRVALFEQDRAWAEEKCLAALENPDESVQAAAITGIGHIGRIHRAVGRAALLRLAEVKNPRLTGLVEDTLEDIMIFGSGVGDKPS